MHGKYVQRDNVAVVISSCSLIHIGEEEEEEVISISGSKET